MRRVSFLSWSLFVALLLRPGAAHAASLILSPADQTVALGSTTTITVLASDLTVGAFDLALSFDPAIVDVTSVVFGSHLGAPLSLQDAHVALGLVTLAETSLLDPADLAALQGSLFPLATITVATRAIGETGIAFAAALIADYEANALTPSLTAARLQVGDGGPNQPPDPPVPVPELPTIGVLGLGLAAIMAASLREARDRRG